MHDATVFLQGVCSSAALVIGLMFFRFWREHRESLFAFFAVAFWLMALSWAVLAVLSPTEETRPYVYGLRLVAFLLIIAGVVAKNRRDVI